jgi:hypothetical protein
MKFRIALFGASELMRTQLADLLRSAEYLVDLYDPKAVASIFDCRLHTYDIVIAGADLAAGFKEETMFTSLLASRGFLIFDEKASGGADDPLFLIHAGMSPETIISRINNVLYLNSSVRKSPRIHVDLPVEYEYEENRCQSTLLDLSEGGAFIMTFSPPTVKTAITLRFSLPGTQNIIAATGHAAYNIICNLDQSIISHPSSLDRKIITLPGFGVAFDWIADDDRVLIREFLNRHS